MGEVEIAGSIRIDPDQLWLTTGFPEHSVSRCLRLFDNLRILNEDMDTASVQPAGHSFATNGRKNRS
jgi:hypothetical protein